MRALGLIIILVLGGCIATYEQRQENTNAAFDAAIENATRDFFSMQPLVASYLRLPEEAVGGRYKDRLAETGPQAHAEQTALLEALLAEMRALNPDLMTADRVEQRAILIGALTSALAVDKTARANGYYAAGLFQSPFLVTQLTGPHVGLPDYLTTFHAFETADDVDAYIARLEAFGPHIDGITELVAANGDAGVIAPDFVLDGALAGVERIIAPDPDAHPVVTHLASQVARLGLDGAADYRARAAEAVATSAYPAYQRLAEVLRAQRADATSAAGVGALPGGARLYNRLARANGETGLAGDQIHALGLKEVARVEAEMDAVLRSLGRTEGGVGARAAAMTADPQYIFANTDEGRADVIAYVEELVARADAASEEYFLAPPQVSVTVQRMPLYAEEGAPRAQYFPPSDDGARPGVFYLNLRDTAVHPRWTLPTLTFHEAIPGHHFQFAIAVESQDTPVLVRQFASSTAYAEGWALYSEALSKEIGLYDDDPEGDFGRLQAEMLRAVRLVIDSGLHAKGWSREQAIDYMAEKTGMEMSDVVTEVERYVVVPGQALGYKIGMLKMQELRARATVALDEDFNVGAFHYEVLRDGGAPLSVLEERIDRWIARGGPAPVR